MSDVKPLSVEPTPVMAIDTYASNAELIEACARLGYLTKEAPTLDCTYGRGTFWKMWRPDNLTASDLNSEAVPGELSIDFTGMPWADGVFHNVVFDPPYKLNGTPAVEADGRYGTHVYTDWRDRMELIRSGIGECARVLGGGHLLLKCQDQVCSGKVRWQTFEFTKHAESCGLELVDRLDLLSYRPQPNGRRQVHARRNASTLLVFKKG